MAERWVSQGRHFCKVCKCWLSKHAASIAAHEASAGHVAKKQKQLKDLYKKEEETHRDKQMLATELARIDAASRLSEETRTMMQLASETRHRTKKARAEEEIQTLIKQYTDQLKTVDDDDNQQSRGPAPASRFFSSEETTATEDQQWLALKDQQTNLPMWINAVTGETTSVNPLVSAAEHPLLLQRRELSLARSTGALAEQYREQVLRKHGLLPENTDAVVSRTASPQRENGAPAVPNGEELVADNLDESVAQQDLGLLSQIKSGPKHEFASLRNEATLRGPDAVGERIAEQLNAKPQVFGPWEAVPLACEKTGSLISEEDSIKQEAQQRKEAELKERLAAERESLAAEAGLKQSSDISLAALKEDLASRRFLSSDDLQLVDDEDG